VVRRHGILIVVGHRAYSQRRAAGDGPDGTAGCVADRRLRRPGRGGRRRRPVDGRAHLRRPTTCLPVEWWSTPCRLSPRGKFQSSVRQYAGDCRQPGRRRSTHRVSLCPAVDTVEAATSGRAVGGHDVAPRRRRLNYYRRRTACTSLSTDTSAHRTADCWYDHYAQKT